jgi:hypothetical protein
MNEQQSMGWIRVVHIPGGEAPFSVRAAWVGLELPCDPYLGYSTPGMERGALTGIPAERNRRGVAVPQAEALRILEQVDPRAAAWWNEHGFPRGDERFLFSEDEIEIISGVTAQRMVVFDDVSQTWSGR